MHSILPKHLTTSTTTPTYLGLKRHTIASYPLTHKHILAVPTHPKLTYVPSSNPLFLTLLQSAKVHLWCLIPVKQLTHSNLHLKDYKCLAKDEDGEVFAFKEWPSRYTSLWAVNLLDPLTALRVPTPPHLENTPWRESLTKLTYVQPPVNTRKVHYYFPPNTRVTVCIVTDTAPLHTYVGIAICDPSDTFDRETGRRIALARALAQAPKRN